MARANLMQERKRCHEQVWFARECCPARLSLDARPGEPRVGLWGWGRFGPAERPRWASSSTFALLAGSKSAATRTRSAVRRASRQYPSRVVWRCLRSASADIQLYRRHIHITSVHALSLSLSHSSSLHPSEPLCLFLALGSSISISLSLSLSLSLSGHPLPALTPWGPGSTQSGCQ